jgi:hypothetical protein
MTEAEWLSGEADADEMLEALKKLGRADPRKLRLHACAWARILWDALGQKTHKRVVELAEDFADGLISHQELTEDRDIAVEYRELYQSMEPPLLLRTAQNSRVPGGCARSFGAATPAGAERSNPSAQVAGSVNTSVSKSKCLLPGLLNRSVIFGSDLPADRLVATAAGTLMIGSPAALWVIVRS